MKIYAKLVKMMIAGVVLCFSSCADTFDWAEPFWKVPDWSFVDGEEKFSESIDYKVFFKNQQNPIRSLSFTVYSLGKQPQDAQVRVTVAGGSGGTVLVNGVDVPNEGMIDVEQISKLDITFTPLREQEVVSYTITIQSVNLNYISLQRTVYTVVGYSNKLPTVTLTILDGTGFDRNFQAVASDTDGTLKLLTYFVTKAGQEDRVHQFMVTPSGEITSTLYTFPEPGSYTVRVAVTDSDDGTASDMKTVVIN